MPGPVIPSEIKNLAPLPQSVIRLAKIVSDPDSSVEEFVHVIMFDAPLTANVLRWANSAWSQSQTAIDNVQAAVIRLGTANVLKLAIGYHLMGSMKQSYPAYNLTENELWRHSVAAALTVEKMKQLIILPVMPAAFSAALMHDIGKIILGRKLGHEALGEMLENLIEEKGYSLIEAEQEILGTDHAQIGAEIAAYWSLPRILIDAIRWHHYPDKEQNILVDMVHTGNIVAACIKERKNIEDTGGELSTGSLQRLGINGEGFKKLCAAVKEELTLTESRWMCQDE